MYFLCFLTVHVICTCNFKPFTFYRITSAKCRINTVVSPDDGHMVARDTSSSSIGTTARCGLCPVEQYPSIFSYLSPTLSIIIKSIQLSSFFDFRDNKFFTVWGC
jgi:hypothetical protein